MPRPRQPDVLLTLMNNIIDGILVFILPNCTLKGEALRSPFSPITAKISLDPGKGDIELHHCGAYDNYRKLDQDNL